MGIHHRFCNHLCALQHGSHVTVGESEFHMALRFSYAPWIPKQGKERAFETKPARKYNSSTSNTSLLESGGVQSKEQ